MAGEPVGGLAKHRYASAFGYRLRHRLKTNARAEKAYNQSQMLLTKLHAWCVDSGRLVAA
jgi:hypothetical protein